MSETINITIFSALFGDFDAVVLQTINTGSANMIALITPLMAACFSIYVLMVVCLYWRGTADMAIKDFFVKLAAWSFVLTAGMNVGYYSTYVVPFFNGVGDDIARALIGTPSSGTALDTLASGYMNGVLAIYQGASGFEQTLTAIAMVLLVVFFGALFFGVAAAFIIVAKFGLGLLLALGPLFISAALFPATRRFFDGWAGQCLNYAFLTALFASASAISIQFMTKHLPAGFGWTIVAETAFMGVVFVVVAFEMPSMASALAGGVGISSLVTNGVASGVKGAGVGAVKGAGKGAAGLTRRGFGALRRRGGGMSGE